MARYIIIDNRSGYVIFDTADYGGTYMDITDPLIACRLHNPHHNYRLTSSLSPQTTGYRVYRVDDEIPIIRDHRHHHLIELVESQCLLVANIRIVS